MSYSGSSATKSSVITIRRLKEFVVASDPGQACLIFSVPLLVNSSKWNHILFINDTGILVLTSRICHSAAIDAILSNNIQSRNYLKAQKVVGNRFSFPDQSSFASQLS